MYQPLSIEKEMHNPKSSIKFYLGNLLRTMDRETASLIILRNYSEEEREEPGYRGVLQKQNKANKKTGSWNI